MKINKITLIHTSLVTINMMTELFNKIIPESSLNHIVDDSILQEILEKEKITKDVLRRMLSYFVAAEKTGADVIFNVCSTVGEVASIASLIVNTPIVRIDERMAEKAVEQGTRIGVVATLISTIDPTCRLIENKAINMGKKINIKKILCRGAFDKLLAGDKEKHDQIVTDYVKKIADDVDIIVFSQSSMGRLVETIDKKLAKKILTSPRLSVLHTREILGLK